MIDNMKDQLTFLEWIYWNKTREEANDYHEGNTSH